MRLASSPCELSDDWRPLRPAKEGLSARRRLVQVARECDQDASPCCKAGEPYDDPQRLAPHRCRVNECQRGIGIEDDPLQADPDNIAGSEIDERGDRESRVRRDSSNP
jgi:hypothetical protein